jgi:hypothetical protein
MRPSRKLGVAVSLASTVTCAICAWIVSGAGDRPADSKTPAEGEILPAFWDGTPAPTEEGDSSGALTTHGGWFCANPDCRFLRMSGGQTFRSAKAQSCSICRQPLVQDRPVAAVPAKGGLTAPEGG